MQLRLQKKSKSDKTCYIIWYSNAFSKDVEKISFQFKITSFACCTNYLIYVKNFN